MKIIFAAFVIIFLPSLAMSQDSDLMFDNFMNYFGHKTANTFQIKNNSEFDHKCAFGIVSEVKLNFDKFDKKQKIIIASVLDRPQLPKNIVSPAGIFRIHYSDIGSDKPSFSVEEFALAADSAYFFETSILGYPPAPIDSGNGGDNLFDIYIFDLGLLYGFTTPDLHISGDKFSSFINIDNDYAGSSFFTHGLNAAKVTVAHEYHHAIQIGNYKFDSNDSFYYELTSTSMEDFVFDYINDYYSYIPRYFNNPSATFSQTRGSGYDLALWNIFLKQRFAPISDTLGYHIIKRSWELIRNQRAILAISNALEESGYSMKTELNNFAVWNYFTGYRYNSNYYKDGIKYPIIKKFAQYTYDLPSVEESISIEPLTNNYLYFIDQTQGISDTLVSVITNGDVESGILNPSDTPEKNSLNYLLSSTNTSGTSVIINGKYYSQIKNSTPDFFTESNFFNNELASSAQLDNRELEFAYPNPFNYTKNSFIRIPVAPNLLNEAYLAIYDASMNNVYTGNVKIFTSSKIVVHWDGLNNKGNKLKTGVYIFVTESNGEIIKGKLVITNSD